MLYCLRCTMHNSQYVHAQEPAPSPPPPSSKAIEFRHSILLYYCSCPPPIFLVHSTLPYDHLRNGTQHNAIHDTCTGNRLHCCTTLRECTSESKALPLNQTLLYCITIPEAQIP